MLSQDVQEAAKGIIHVLSQLNLYRQELIAQHFAFLLELLRAFPCKAVIMLILVQLDLNLL